MIQPLVKLAKLPKLTSLRLAGKELPPDAAAELKGLTALKELYLSVGPLPEAGMKALGALDRLEVLQLGRFKPGADKVIPHVAKLTKLRTLDLAGNRLIKIEGIEKLSVLEDLWLNNNQINDLDTLPLLSSSCPRIATLYLEQNPVCNVLGDSYRAAVLKIVPTLTQLDADDVMT